MLIQIQKKLNDVVCPSCEKKQVLEATLSCSRDDKKCQTFCQCSNCGTNLLFEMGQEVDIEKVDLSSYAIRCSLETRNCVLEALPVGLSGTENVKNFNSKSSDSHPQIKSKGAGSEKRNAA